MSEVPLEQIEPAGRLHALYSRAGDFELELERAAARDRDVLLTIEQKDRFNDLLQMARRLVPNSIALKEDAEEAEEVTRALDAHHMLKITIVPSLHNALPAELAVR
jgi:hypothetical protein